jgi:hypothetical protein
MSTIPVRVTGAHLLDRAALRLASALIAWAERRTASERSDTHRSTALARERYAEAVRTASARGRAGILP